MHQSQIIRQMLTSALFKKQIAADDTKPRRDYNNVYSNKKQFILIRMVKDNPSKEDIHWVFMEYTLLCYLCQLSFTSFVQLVHSA